MEKRGKAANRALGAAFLGVALAAVPGHPFSAEGEALLEDLRDRIAGGRGGEEAYRQALDMLAADPDGGCGEWSGDEGPDYGMDPILRECLGSVCGGDPGGVAGRASSAAGFGWAASQSVKPRSAGSEAPRWSAHGEALGASARVSGDGGRWRGRKARIGAGDFALQLGHWGGAMRATRIPGVLGNRSYAGVGAVSGIGGPLGAVSPVLDGAALSWTPGRWRLEAGGAWNRLEDAPAPGKPAARRDAGLVAAGLARSPADGSGWRAQALLLRTETSLPRTGPAEENPVWLAVAGIEGRWRRADFSGRAAAAVSAGPGRHPAAHPGAFAEGQLAYRDPRDGNAPEWDPYPMPAAGGWSLSFRQAGGDWSNPLQSPRGFPGDSAGGWPADAPLAGGLRAESGFPLGTTGTYSAGLRAAASAEWADPGGRSAPLDQASLRRARGEMAWLQIWGPLSCHAGGSLGWAAPGSGTHAYGGWRASLEWRHALWRAGAALGRREAAYAGTRPMPLDLALSRIPPRQTAAEFTAAWSAADARRPLGSQRIDLRQSWPGGKGIRVEQRLRLPWTPRGLGGDFLCQLTVKAEF